MGQRVRNEYIVQDNGYDYTTFDCTPPSVEVGFETPEVVVRDFVIDQTSPIEEILVESEKDGFDYRYTVGLDRISVNVLSPDPDTNHERTQTATKQWLHSDRLGSTVNSTDSFGRVTERTDYNEWGEITFHEKIQNVLGYRTINTDQTYTNHDYDVVLGLYYAKARMYDPRDKRFLQLDKLSGFITLSTSLNKYQYAYDNPNKYIDPLGLFVFGDQLIAYGTNNKDDVIQLQTRLNEVGKTLGFTAGTADGVFGNNTLYAVNKYKDKYLPNGNTGKNRGVVGTTTWLHLNLPIDFVFVPMPVLPTYYPNLTCDVEEITSEYTPEMDSQAFYGTFHGPRLEVSNGKFQGATWGGGGGLVELSKDFKHLEVSVALGEGDAQLGIGNFTGGKLGITLISGEAVTVWSIPFTDHQLLIGVEGDLGSFGLEASYHDGKIKIGASALIGGSVILGIR